MGLLTDAKQRQWLVRFILRYHQKLSILLYIGGVLWFFALAYRPLNAGTYFSENALLPGLVESHLPQGFPSLQDYATALKEEMKKDKKRTPREWMFKQFQDLGLETYRHNYTVQYPFKIAIPEDIQGENIYAILRARRAASTEALVLMAPMRPGNSKKGHTYGGIALMMALAEQFRKNPYWSKDVIFLLVDMEEVGVLAWLDAYHGTQSPYIITQDLPGRSGAIQAAINLEIPPDKVRYLNLKVEGLNGQLPNLDLVNLAVRLGRREQVQVMLHKRADHHNQETWDGFQQCLGTMLHMMWTQASGGPSGCHGIFLRYHIEALTLEGVSMSKGLRFYSLEQLARVVEGIFRSLNNLLERFHQSFFFYLLPSTDRYVSIGLYMPPFGLMVLSAVVKALALWIMTASPPESEQKEDEDTSKENADGEKGSKEKQTDCKDADEEKETESKDQATESQDVGDKEKMSPTKDSESHNDSSAEKKRGLLEGGDGAEEVAQEEEEDSDDEDGFEMGQMMQNFLSVVPTILTCFLLGLLMYTVPSFMTRFKPNSAMNLRPDDIIAYGVLAVFTAGLTYPYLMMRKRTPEEHIATNWLLLKCFGLLLQGLILFAVSLINISLAFFIGAATLPVMMAVRAVKNRVLQAIQAVFLLIVSPVGMLWIVAIVQAAEANAKASPLEILSLSIDEMKSLTFVMLVDRFLLHSWTYLVFCMAFMPAWLLFWTIPYIIEVQE